MKVYDCFTFFNELDLLEIRLKELEGIVDYFVISEADKTHSGEKKEFIFEKNKRRFEKWKDKIIYKKVEMPEFNFLDKIVIFLQKKTHNQFISSNFGLGKWKLENFQRKELIKGLINCKEEDIIIVSDLDEIPRIEKIREAKKILASFSGKIGFKQDLFNHFLNGYVNSDWIGTKAVKYKFLVNRLKSNLQLVRLRRFHFQLNRIGIKENIKILNNGGWHFNNIGKKEEIISKIVSKADADVFKGNDLQKQIKVDGKCERYLGPVKHKLKIIKIDKTFPEEIYNNQKKYSHLIKKIG